MQASHGQKRLMEIFRPDVPELPSLLATFYRSWERAFDNPSAYGIEPLRETPLGEDTPDEKLFVDVSPGMVLPSILQQPTDAVYNLLVQLAKLISAKSGETDSTPLARFGDLVDWESGPIMRVTHYPGHSDVVNAPHSDINIFTLLPAASTLGLEILVDDAWVSAPTDACDILILMGELASELDGTHADIHRVIGTGRQRLSISLFVNARPNIILPTGRTAGDLLQERIHALAQTKSN